MSYDIELNDVEVVDDKKTQDNTQTIKESLVKIEEILNDIDERLKSGNL